MGLFSSLTNKKKAAPAFDAQTEEAALRCSICTGEQTAGFRNKNTGHFREIMLIRSPADLDDFKREYGVEEVKKIF